MEKEYGSFINNYKCNNYPKLSNRTVWICWLQGRDNAPELVKACINSIENNLKDFNIVILTEENISKYTMLPVHVMKKYNEGKITRTHFSDILRVSILCEYGGLWVDSTVLCTDGDRKNYRNAFICI